MFKMLRPVGNKIYFCHQALSQDLFAPFRTQYYQSGTAALSATLIAAQQASPKIKTPKVLLPAYGCPDLISAAIYANIEPVLINLEPDSPWMELDTLKQKIKTDSSIIAIIAVNFLGIPERTKEISNLIDDYNIALIEDSAQDFPTSIDNFLPYSDFIISSFGRGKPLSLLGGGIVLTKDDVLYNYLPATKRTKPTLMEKLKYRLKVTIYNMLIKPFFYYLLHFLPIKLGETIYKPLTSIKACPEYILELIAHNYSNYCNRKTPNIFYTQMLSRINSNQVIDLPLTCNINMDKPLLRYPILVKNYETHKNLTQSLENAGLGMSIMYKAPLPNIAGITESMFKEKTDVTNASTLASQLLTLPTHNDVSTKNLKHIEYIFNTVLKNEY